MTEGQVLLFEDARVADLAPVAATRPAFELRYGLWNLRERVEAVLPEATGRVRVRPELRDCLRESLPAWSGGLEASGRILAVNARALMTDESLRALWAARGHDHVVREDGELVWATGDLSHVEEILSVDESSEGASSSGIAEIRLARGLWDHVRVCGQQICEDFRALASRGDVPRRIFATLFDEGSPRANLLRQSNYGGPELGIVHPGVHLLEPDAILFGQDCEVRPGVVLDASAGPIVIGCGAIVHSLSVLVGPCHVGSGTIVQPGTRVREATSLGAFCKVGGEIEDVVMLDLSNKQHDGFLGHAYVGQWVNLGADTNGSDLKNNYGPVRVDFGDRQVDTGEMFVGPLLGDHVKTAINTMLNTGSFVGAASNLFGGGFPPSFVSPFSWGGQEGLVEYRLDKAIETARAVLARRDVRWTPTYEALLRWVFESSAGHRGGASGLS